MKDRSTNQDIESYLCSVGTIFRVLDQQDSGCVSYSVEVDGERVQVKHAAYNSVDTRGCRAIEALENAIRFHGAITHPAIPPLLYTVTTPQGLSLVYRWVNGEVLSSSEWPDKRTNPASPYSRFQRLAPTQKLRVLNTIFEAHSVICAAGYVAVDFYLGAILYDFDTACVRLIDFDAYHPGPYVLEADRQLGSTSLMAPEEFERGAVIDQRATLCTLGKLALEFLADRKRDRAAWQGAEAAYNVIHRATEPGRADRFPGYATFYRAWQTSLSGEPAVR